MTLVSQISAALERIGAEFQKKVTTNYGGGEETTLASGTSGAVTLDLSTGNWFVLVPTGNVTSLTISNVPDSGVRTLRLVVEHGATPRSIAAPANTHWIGTNPPAAVANKIAVYDFATMNGGDDWLGSCQNTV